MTAALTASTGPALVAATLLAVAGAQKLVDPAMTSGALGALGLPASSGLVRIGAAAELALGVAAVVIGGRVTWWLVAASYLAFSAFVIGALRRGAMIGSCGCFGREDTPPHLIHVVLNVALAGVAASAASRHSSILDELDGGGVGAAALVALATLAVYVLHATYVHLPRSLAATRAPT